jgi:hypothetical protein
MGIFRKFIAPLEIGTTSDMHTLLACIEKGNMHVYDLDDNLIFFDVFSYVHLLKYEMHLL